MYQKWSLALLFLFCLSACIRVEESFIFYRDGSGEMQYILDYSDLHPLLGTDAGGPENPLISFSSLKNQLDSLDGIESVVILDQPDQLVFGFRFSFTNLQSLNQALNLLFQGHKMGPNYPRIQKKDNYWLIDHQIPPIKVEESFEQNPIFVQNLAATLQEMQYTLNLQFEEQVKVVYSQVQPKVAKRKLNHFSLSTNFEQLLAEPSYLSAKIVVK